MPNLESRWPKTLESESRISKLSYETFSDRTTSKESKRNHVGQRRWRVRVPNLESRWPKTLESQSPESQNLKANLRKLSA